MICETADAQITHLRRLQPELCVANQSGYFLFVCSAAAAAGAVILSPICLCFKRLFIFSGNSYLHGSRNLHSL